MHARLVVALFVSWCAACIGDDLADRRPEAPDRPAGGDDAGAEDAGVQPGPRCPELALSVDGLSLLRGSHGALHVRVSGVPESERVTIRTLAVPSGLTVPGEILAPPGSAEPFDVEIRASDSAPYGVVNLQMLASCGEDSASLPATARVVVRGVPGALDTSYGTQGVAEAPVGARLTEAILDGDTLVAAGVVNRAGAPDPYEDEIVLSRLTAEGKLDPTFGVAGSVFVPRPTGPGLPYSTWTRTRHALVPTTAGFRHTVSFRMDGEARAFVLTTTVPHDGSTVTVTPTVGVPIVTGPTTRTPVSPDGDDGAFFLFVDGKPSHVDRYLAASTIDLGWAAGGSVNLDGVLGKAPSETARIYSYTVTPTRIAMLAGVTGPSSIAYWFVLLDRSDGHVVAKTLISSGYELPMWLSRDVAPGTYRVAAPSKLWSFDAQGTPAKADGEAFLGGADGDGVYVGPLGGGQNLLVQYSEAHGKFHLIAADGKRATPPEGTALEPFTASSNRSLIDALPASEDRVLLLFGADDAYKGWAVRRYWL